MTDNKQSLPGHETQSDEMNCPSCKRFVGAVSKCPYCGTKVEKRMSLVAIRWAAVLLATVGLFLLYLMAKHREIPVVMLGNIKPTMNFGQIRVVGQVEDARTFKSGGMGFNVSDGTGTIMVFVSQKQAKDLADLNLIPRAGDAINFAGGLNISDEESSMRLLSVKDVTLTRATANSVRLADVNDSLVGTSISIAGKVVSVVAPPADTKRPYDIKIADDSGEKTLNCWATEFDQIKNKDALVGSYVRVRVTVASYKDKLQLKLASGLDIEILDAPPTSAEKPVSAAQKAAATFQKENPAPKRDFSRGRLEEAVSVASLSAAKDGQTVKVRGEVVSVRAPEAGTKQPFSLILKEGDASIRVTYWSSVDEVIAVKPTVGAVFEIEGVIEVYQDKPQLKLESGYKIKAIESAAVPSTTPAETPAPSSGISAITAADKGQVRTVQGTLGAPRALGKGTAYALSDESGTIDLILWDSTVPVEVRDSLKEGATVSATGVVGEYESKLQLKANSGTSIRILQ